MKRVTYLLASASFLFLIGCSESKTSNVETGTPVAPFTTNAQAVPAANSQQPAEAASTALNPPHGQPGHRCDIEVGAPLNSAPNKAANPIVSTPTVPAQVLTPPPASGSVAAGTNPPHGQPGHRCDIAVGAPLNSAPNTSGGTSTSANSPVPQTPVLSAPVFTPPPASGSVAAGTNPPHGQPGHDCSIAVGAPLKK